MTAHSKARRHANSRLDVRALSDLRRGEDGVLEQIEMTSDDAQRMMELGFIPGAIITAGRAAPGGDPRVYRVDGSEVALRRETASRIKLRAAVSCAD